MSMESLTSPRNHGPEKTMAALPSLKSEVIRAVEGSRGRTFSPSTHVMSSSRALTFSGRFMVG
jgi:hypothetical protein